MVSVYMTVQGRSIDVTTAIAESQANLGVESTKPWLPEFTPLFVDYPFTDPSATFNDHLAVVRDVEPEVAVAPDIEHGRALTDVVSKADQLAKHADAVVVVPKSVPPEDVPDRFRVGVPLADFGTGAPWSLWRYRQTGPVHLLGGGPARQLKAGKHLPVASADTASLGKLCQFGYWDGKSQDAPESWDYRRRLRESLDNYADAWDVLHTNH